MKNESNSKPFIKCICFVISGLLFLMLNTSAYAEWHGGIGTGLSSQDRYGDIGLHTEFGDLELDYDLGTQDFKDHLESAFGFAGYFSDGRWMIQYSLAYLELEDDASGVRPSGSKVTADITFKTTSAEVTVGLPVLKYNNLVLGAHTGLRYIKHDYESSITNVGTTIDRDFDHDWADLLLGATLTIIITKQLSLNNQINFGYGGSDGTFMGSTGVSWRFHKNFSTGLTAKVLAVDYENGSKGDSDWYLYDVDESSLVAGLLYHW